jgi:hypothetical protein
MGRGESEKKKLTQKSVIVSIHLKLKTKKYMEK